MLGVVVAVYDYGTTEGIICNSILTSTLESQDVVTQIEYSYLVRDFALASPLDGNAIELTIFAFQSKFPCVE